MQDRIQTPPILTQAEVMTVQAQTTTTQDLKVKPFSLAESYPMVFDLLIDNFLVDIKKKEGELNFENEDVKSLFQLTFTYGTYKNRELALLILSNSLEKKYSSEGLKKLLNFLKENIPSKRKEDFKRILDPFLHKFLKKNLNDKFDHEIFKLSDELGFDINTKDEYGQTLLHIACEWGKLEAVEYLLKQRRANIHTKNNNGDTPLHLACLSDKYKIVKYLVEHYDLDINAKNKHQQTPLHLACENESSRGVSIIVKYLVDQPKIDINAKNKHEQTPLHLACSYDKIETVKFFAEQRLVDIDAKDKCGQTPLHFACYIGSLEAVEYLLEKGDADINAKDNDGLTPLHYACRCVGKHETVKYLLDKGATHINAKDNNGNTPLHYACYIGSLEAVKYLLELGGADINAKDNDGLTPLHYACRFAGNLETVKYLVECTPADILAIDNYGRTPLHFACENRHWRSRIEKIKYLLEHCRADISAKDNNGRIPFDYLQDDDRRGAFNFYENLKREDDLIGEQPSRFEILPVEEAQEKEIQEGSIPLPEREEEILRQGILLEQAGETSQISQQEKNKTSAYPAPVPMEPDQIGVASVVLKLGFFDLDGRSSTSSRLSSADHPRPAEIMQSAFSSQNLSRDNLMSSSTSPNASPRSSGLGSQARKDRLSPNR